MGTDNGTDIGTGGRVPGGGVDVGTRGRVSDEDIGVPTTPQVNRKAPDEDEDNVLLDA